MTIEFVPAPASIVVLAPEASRLMVLVPLPGSTVRFKLDRHGFDR